METLEELRSRLKSAVGENTGEAINKIEKELRADSNLYSEFLICKNKHNSINTDYYKGVITDNERGLQHSKLLGSVLALIDRLEKRDLLSFKDNHLDNGNSLLNKTPEKASKYYEEAPEKKFLSIPSTTFLTRGLWRGPYRKLLTSSLVIVAMLFVGWAVASRLTKKTLPDQVPLKQTPDAAGSDNKLPPPADSYVPSDFEIIERRTTIDFRAWRKVPRKLMETDRVEPMIWHQYLKIEKKGDSKFFIVKHWSDGYTLDFACISHDCIKRPPIAEATKDGAAKYKIFQIEFDVSKYVIHEQFIIEYQVVYWNAYQKDESESVAVIPSNPTRLLTVEIYFPDSVQDDLVFRYAKRDENVNYIQFNHPNARYKNKHLEWRIENPSLDIFYGVQWKWKA